MEECEVIPFRYDGHVVEAFRYSGKIWFMAGDLGRAIGIGNIRETINRMLKPEEVIRLRRYRMYRGGREYVDPIINEDEPKKIGNVKDLSQNVTRSPEDLSQNVTRVTYPIAISEQGLYMMMMRKRGVRAENFRKWVMSDLPDMISIHEQQLPIGVGGKAIAESGKIRLSVNMSTDKGSMSVNFVLNAENTQELETVRGNITQMIDSLQ